MKKKAKVTYYKNPCLIQKTAVQKVKQTNSKTRKLLSTLYVIESFSPTSYDLEILINISSALGSLLLSGCLKKSTDYTIKFMHT